MPSAYASPQRYSPSLPLNGKIQSRASNNSSPELPHKGLRTPQPSLGKPWLLTWTHSIQKSMDVGSYNTWMTCCWLPRPRKNVGKGQKHCSSCWWKQVAAAKPLQSSLTLCDPIDGSPPGSPVPGILQVITLEWVTGCQRRRHRSARRR